MLTHPTLEKLSSLGLHGMAKAFSELAERDDVETLTHGEWLALLLEREETQRHDRRLHARLRYARLRHVAAPEDINWKASRGLDRSLFTALLKTAWIDAADTAIITGPTGVGKSWLACAIGLQACRDNRSVLYVRASKLFADLALAHVDGRYPRLMRALGGVKLLILDDFGMSPLGARERQDLMEIIEERYGRGATLITSQLPVDHWHDVIGDPTYADAVLDRLVHNANRITLTGDSLRRQKQTRADA
ncbi:MAG: IS21-like element helper ATPase IstB [Caulobacteraceae bacterium]